MRLATLLTPRGLRACAQIGDDYVDFQATDPGLPNSVKRLLAASATVKLAAQEAINSPQAVRYPAVTATLVSPVPDPEKILCVGLNYRDHAIEGGKEIPSEPVLFCKYANTLVGDQAAVSLPRVSTKVDYEAELVIVVGKRGRYIPRESAMDYVGGYTCGHDVSARDWQLEKPEKQWSIGKTFDTFAPVGPVIVTADELTDPHQLRVQLRLNGITMQDSNTREFIFQVPEIMAYLSQVVTLEPGDLIFTGTPPGVGISRKPPVLLKPGDKTEVEIESIGVLRNHFIAETGHPMPKDFSRDRTNS